MIWGQRPMSINNDAPFFGDISVSVGGGGEGDQSGIREEKPEMLALEAADANAISEVNLAYENVKEVDGLDITKEGCEAWEAAMKRYEDRIDRVETRITARSGH